jgi:hypothetical protein
MLNVNGKEKRFTVVRHGGRATDSWRILLATDDKAWAQASYEKMAKQFRQGAVQRQEDDKVLCRLCAPSLRTRW